EALAFPDVRLVGFTVDVQLDPHTKHRSSARLVRMRKACRLYAAVPRTSSIGLAASATRCGNESASPSSARTSVGTGPAEPTAARSSPSTRTARETTAITIALRDPT